MFPVVQMDRHRLYFSPSTAGLDALEISQTKLKEKGLQLAISQFPLDHALKNTGPSFSILALLRAATLNPVSLFCF